MNIATNKKAYFDYEILEAIEAGLILAGYEVKAIRMGLIDLKGAHISIKNDKAFVINLHIGKYPPAGPLPDYDTMRERELLLRKKQIFYLQSKMKENGLTVVPLRVYNKARLLKLEIGIARGKKLYDKRAILKKKAINKDIKMAINHKS